MLEMTRGDTKKYKFQRKDAEGNVIKAIPDALFFTVKSNQYLNEFLFQKTINDMVIDDEGFWHFEILPEDTNNLKFRRYVYDLEVIQGGVKTTISKGDFNVTYEVTYQINE